MTFLAWLNEVDFNGFTNIKFMGYALVIPRFVLEEMQIIADSTDPQRQAKGRKGLETLNKLKNLPSLDLRIHESSVDTRRDVDAKLVFLAQSLKAKLLTTDFNLAQMAQFQGVEWLNINALAKAISPELNVGETIKINLIKPGKKSHLELATDKTLICSG